jgi:hypothetical protein
VEFLSALLNEKPKKGVPSLVPSHPRRGPAEGAQEPQGVVEFN